MADTITPTIVALPEPPVTARAQITAAQVTALITLIASADPAIITLPDGLQFTQVKRFNLNVLPNGNGAVNIVFN